MDVEQRISQVLTKKLGFYVPTSDIGHETLWAYKDELDSLLLDETVLVQLDETVIAHSVSYEAEDGTYYSLLQILLIDETLHELWLVNDVLDKHFLEGVE